MYDDVTPKKWREISETACISPAEFAAAAFTAGKSCIVNGGRLAVRAFSTLSVSGNTAVCVGVCKGADTMSVTVRQTLEKRGPFRIWHRVYGAQWGTMDFGRAVVMQNTRPCLDSGTYRLKTVFTLMNSVGETETITACSSEENL